MTVKQNATGQTWLAHCEQTASNIWLVSCLLCGSSLGSMSTNVLNEAIKHNARRGGILCPECRSRLCPRCWCVDTADSRDDLCTLCLVESSSLSIVQNSTNVLNV